MVKAVNELDKIGSNAQERDIYEGEVKKRMVDAIQLKSAKQEGKQEGMQEGMLLLVEQQMRRLLGDIPAEVVARLQRLSPDALRDLGLDLFDFRSYVDVEAWLARR